jgi:serine protease Do
LVNARGELLGVLGKELRNRETNAWLNYALPVAPLREQIADLAAGRGARRRDEAVKRPAQAYKPSDLGISLVPDALEHTPPYIDRIHAGGAAERAGLRADDLVVMVNDHLASSCQAVATELASIDRADPVKLTLLRGQTLVEVTLEPTAGGPR